MFNVRLAGGHLYGKQLFTWLSLVVSLISSFVLSVFPLDVLGEIWDLIESVSEGFLTYSCHSSSRYIDLTVNKAHIFKSNRLSITAGMRLFLDRWNKGNNYVIDNCRVTLRLQNYFHINYYTLASNVRRFRKRNDVKVELGQIMQIINKPELPFLFMTHYIHNISIIIKFS